MGYALITFKDQTVDVIARGVEVVANHVQADDAMQALLSVVGGGYTIADNVPEKKSTAQPNLAPTPEKKEDFQKIYLNGGSTANIFYGNYLLVTPEWEHKIKLTYEGEPPHGDAYHLVDIDAHRFPGYAWGCRFGASESSRFLVFSWMEKKYERKTVVVDMGNKSYFVLPEYLHEFKIKWPSVIGEGEKWRGKSYTFTGLETWIPYVTESK